jgi:hypothetical protein
MVSVLASRAVDRGFESLLVKPKTIKLVSVASPISTQHWRELGRNQDNVSECHDISIQYCYFSELAL